jgi:hypothetical protein
MEPDIIASVVKISLLSTDDFFSFTLDDIKL